MKRLFELYKEIFDSVPSGAEEIFAELKKNVYNFISCSINLRKCYNDFKISLVYYRALKHVVDNKEIFDEKSKKFIDEARVGLNYFLETSKEIKKIAGEYKKMEEISYISIDETTLKLLELNSICQKVVEDYIHEYDNILCDINFENTKAKEVTKS